MVNVSLTKTEAKIVFDSVLTAYSDDNLKSLKNVILAKIYYAYTKRDGIKADMRDILISRNIIKKKKNKKL